MDKEEMLKFCCDFKGESTIMVDERKVISVPLESLPSCFHKIFSETNCRMLSNYLGSWPLIVGVEIVQDPPYARQQQMHVSTSISFALSLTLEIVFENFVTTWLIPGSHKRHRLIPGSHKRHRTAKQQAQLIQPCIQQSKYAIVECMRRPKNPEFQSIFQGTQTQNFRVLTPPSLKKMENT